MKGWDHHEMVVDLIVVVNGIIINESLADLKANKEPTGRLR